nr:PREDICTED: glycosylphosphatidylinositol anchor attachment 1 protein-like [Nicotiana tabacum]
MEILSKRLANYKNRHSELLLQGGRLVEGVIRSVNNLLEKFHQSFFLYLLTSPNRFVSVGVYMIPFALLVAPLPMVAASLFADASRKNSGMENKEVTTFPAFSDIPTITFGSWRWLHAAKTVFIVHFWGAVVTLLPHFLSLVPDSPPLTNLLTWIVLSVSSLLILQVILGSSFSLPSMNQTQGMEWTLLKSVTIAAACTGLCIMSVINFATAEIGALMLVPMCLMARPLRIDAKAKTLKSFSRAACNVVLIILFFPPVTFYLWKGALVGLDNARIGDFWNWVESLWTWNSATYIYICMVHLPCWVLCVHTLGYPC